MFVGAPATEFQQKKSAAAGPRLKVPDVTWPCCSLCSRLSSAGLAPMELWSGYEWIWVIWVESQKKQGVFSVKQILSEYFGVCFLFKDDWWKAKRPRGTSWTIWLVKLDARFESKMMFVVKSQHTIPFCHQLPPYQPPEKKEQQTELEALYTVYIYQLFWATFQQNG